LIQACSAVVDERAESKNRRLWRARLVQNVGLDSLVGGDRETGDVGAVGLKIDRDLAFQERRLCPRESHR